MRLSEIVNALDDQEFQVKVAALEQAWAGDEAKLGLLDEAIDIVKEAEESGELAPLTDSQALSAAVQLVEEHVASYEPEITKEAAEEIYGLGQLAAVVLAENGITAEDLEKVASEEEAEQLGRVTAHLVANALQEAEE